MTDLTAMNRFVDRIAVITGAGSGIGAATSRRFASEGASGVVADIDDDAAASVVEQIEASGGDAWASHCDVSSTADWKALAEAVETRHGRVDVVHNNAFTRVFGAAHELAEADWEHQISVNLSSVYRSVRAFMPALRASKGCIVNTASVRAVLGFPGDAAYTASKGGMLALTRQLAVEYGPEVRVNAVLPGPILTPSWNGADDSVVDLHARSTAAGRVGSPDEVAAAVCFLASADASYITGASLAVDGGFMAKKDPS